jgi:hypothetical protein
VYIVASSARLAWFDNLLYNEHTEVPKLAAATCSSKTEYDRSAEQESNRSIQISGRIESGIGERIDTA